MRILIAGAGYLGEALADRLAERGDSVTALTGSEASAERLQAKSRYAAIAADIGDASALAAALEADAGGYEAVVHCASSRGGGGDVYRRVFVEGSRNLLSICAGARFVFTSSTSVYAQTGGEWVDECSPALPERETGRVLREAEDEVLASQGIVARVAGIYGPERSVLLRKFFDGSARIEGDGSRYVNQVHRDDIVSAYVLLLDLPAQTLPTPALFNVADSRPQSQRDVYTWLAQRYGRPLPARGPLDLERKRGWTHKRVSSARLRALGWQPRYAAFQHAVEKDPGVSAGSLGRAHREAGESGVR